MAYKDLREWIKQVDEIGELNRIEGARCYLGAWHLFLQDARAIFYDT